MAAFSMVNILVVKDRLVYWTISKSHINIRKREAIHQICLLSQYFNVKKFRGNIGKNGWNKNVFGVTI